MQVIQRVLFVNGTHIKRPVSEPEIGRSTVCDKRENNNKTRQQNGNKRRIQKKKKKNWKLE